MLIDWSKMHNPGKTIYSYEIRDLIEGQIPKTVKDAMSICGWDALGVYELVKFALAAEKRHKRRASHKRTTDGKA